jgi:hypothetical protein
MTPPEMPRETREVVSDSGAEAEMVYYELHAVVRRYINESDKLTVFGVVGALEAVKIDVLDMLARHNNKPRPGDGL